MSEDNDEKVVLTTEGFATITTAIGNLEERVRIIENILRINFGFHLPEDNNASTS